MGRIRQSITYLSPTQMFIKTRKTHSKVQTEVSKLKVQLVLLGGITQGDDELELLLESIHFRPRRFAPAASSWLAMQEGRSTRLHSMAALRGIHKSKHRY